MSIKRFFIILVTVCASAVSVMAQNMSQQEANTYLAGTWHAGGKVLSFYDNGGARSAVIYGDDYTYWSIYTNTFNFESGSLQATNSNPQRNITVKYRNLTRSTCEFLIDGNWVRATKGGNASRPVVTTERPSNNTDQQHPNNIIIRPADNTNQQSSNNTIIRPTDNTNQQPSDNTVQRPSKTNVQRPAGSKVTRPSKPQQRPSRNVQLPNRKPKTKVVDNSKQEEPVVIN